MRPANGSAIVLHTKAAGGPASLAVRRHGVAGSASTVANPRSAGDGTSVTMSVEERLRADRLEARRAHQREQLAGRGSRAQPRRQLLLRQRAVGEERVHQLFVGLGHHLDQRVRATRGPRRPWRPGISADVVILPSAVKVDASSRRGPRRR